MQKARKKDLKAMISKKKVIITQIVNEWDPVGLLAMEAPINEYEQEINIIASWKTNQKLELADRILALFSRQFNESFDHQDCLQIAPKLLKEYEHLTR